MGINNNFTIFIRASIYDNLFSFYNAILYIFKKNT